MVGNYINSNHFTDIWLTWKGWEDDTGDLLRISLQWHCQHLIKIWQLSFLAIAVTTVIVNQSLVCVHTLACHCSDCKCYQYQSHELVEILQVLAKALCLDSLTASTWWWPPSVRLAWCHSVKCDWCTIFDRGRRTENFPLCTLMLEMLFLSTR